jgi:predicted O-methyltransferase YrrM
LSVLNDPQLEALLADLHAKSAAQAPETDAYFRTRTGPWHGMEARDHAHFADKLVALDRDKAEFCYGLCRAIGARRVVEVGSSFGVSTMYLAAAVRDNGGGVVIGGEYEPQKVAAARANFAATGLARYIDLREGDLLETFETIEGPIDFVLFDVWVQVVRPTLDLLLPRLRPAAVLCADNTAGERNRQNYAPYFEVIGDPTKFRTQTLPFNGGFEMSIRV